MQSKRLYPLLLLTGVLMAGLSPLLVNAKGAPVSLNLSKNFRNLIIQGERPEIVACMVASNRYFKKVPNFAEMRWLDSTSQTALMHEKEIDHHLTRIIALDAEVIPNANTFFKSWTPVKIECIQVDEGDPQVKVVAAIEAK